MSNISTKDKKKHGTWSFKMFKISVLAMNAKISDNISS